MSLLCKKALHRCQLTWLLLAAAAAAVLLIRLVRRRRRRPKTRQGKLKIAFAHPDLGIGGAERLVVDAALGLRGRGHDVTIYTARHDPRRCFDETRDGTLRVVVAGDWLPKRILGRCYALCASVRMVAVALRAARDGPDVVVVDQVATAVPVARAACAAPVVFYCHYPDKLLCVNRQNPLTRLYRAPLDWGEETCTGLADVVLVNSRFTAGVFGRAFPRLAVAPEVLYPPLSLDAEVAEAPRDAALLLSINRFERKKNLGLAVEALALLPPRVRLVLAGGYDPDLPENVEHARELEELAARLGVADRVTQRRSVSGDEKARLLARCACLLYTRGRGVPANAIDAGPHAATQAGERALRHRAARGDARAHAGRRRGLGRAARVRRRRRDRAAPGARSADLGPSRRRPPRRRGGAAGHGRARSRAGPGVVFARRLRGPARAHLCRRSY